MAIGNKRTFETWNSGMAWELGFIFTDGNIAMVGNKRLAKRLTITQKDEQTLQKIAVLLNCKHRLYLKCNGNGKFIYCLYTYDKEIYDDLVALGLTERKSLTIKFPIIPKEYLRDFIRGCWDGNGSVYVESRSKQLRASYTSGSYDFIATLAEHLKQIGIPKITIHATKGRRGHYIKINSRHVITLFHYLYDGASPFEYMERKREIFKQSVTRNVPAEKAISGIIINQEWNNSIVALQGSTER